MLLGVMSYFGGMGTFGQVLLGLPMVLDLLGPPSFLLLSLLLTLHHFAYSTLRLLLKNTPFAPLISILSFLSPSITSLLFLLTFYFYQHPPTPSASTALIPSPIYTLVEVLPVVYAKILRIVSPLFTLLEGVSTLLVVQVAGRVGKGWADEEEKEEGGLEWRSLGALVLAALVYAVGLAGVYMIFPISSSSAIPAFLLGCALTAVVFLSSIGFALKRTNVLETSLVFVYVVYSAWLSGIESAMEPRTFGSGWLTSSFAAAKPVREETVHKLAKRAVIGVMDSVWDVAQTLPPHLLLSLVYRVAVLHLAARIVPVIRKASMGWDDGMSDSSTGVTPGFWDGRSLGEEPANMRVTTVVLSYRRAILIAVYTHLLFLPCTLFGRETIDTRDLGSRQADHSRIDEKTEAVCVVEQQRKRDQGLGKNVEEELRYIKDSSEVGYEQLLDAGSQTWWRWLNIALFLAVWSLELLLDAEDDTDSVTRWKVD